MWMRMCPGLKRQNMRNVAGYGSHTCISHTSRVLSGCARWSAVSGLRISWTRRRGVDEAGDESTRTRCAEGVPGPAASTFISKNR